MVTGAGGFIGRHLTEELVDSGAHVTGFVWQGAKKNNILSRDLPQEKLEKVTVHFGDLKDRDSLGNIMDGMDVVFHLAAINSVPYSLLHPGEVIENNVTGTLNLLSAARECGAKRIVVTSSAGVYGPAGGLPIGEKHRTVPASPYAASKLAGEEIALGFFHSYGLPVVILRPFNTFGPGQSMKAVLPNIILQALRNKDVKLGRTDSVRDFNYVLNTVSGFTAAGIAERAAPAAHDVTKQYSAQENPGPKAGLSPNRSIEGEVFNIASGTAHSIRDAIDMVQDILNTKLKIIIEDKRKRPGKSDSDRLRASIKKAQDMLNYKPAISFFDGLKHTIEYYSRHLKDYDSSNHRV